MKKEIIVVGDIEMGGGTITDDFISDASLAKLILSLCKRKHPVDMILNGDTFDFLKCPYIHNLKKTYPRHITATISIGKLHLVYNAHTKVFNALTQFVKQKKNALYFIIGNHDPDLIFKEIQDEIKKILGASDTTIDNVKFQMSYRHHKVYTEHGHQYDFFNKINLTYPFINYKKTKILNVPWASFVIIGGFLTMKEEYPFMERISPHPVLFSLHRSLMTKLSWRGMKYFIKSILFYPFRYFFDPTYMFPREVLREAYKRVKEMHWDVDKVVDAFRKQRRALGNHRIHVLGHTHEQYVEERGKWVILHPDTWRDEYILDKKTRRLYPKTKRYVDIIVNDDDTLTWDLVDIPIKRHILNFDKVMKHEVRFIQEVAQEEGFRFPLL
ncbi:hypothetical protein COV17_01745 [Candidatus Woesearchaeota archaeon CG10_big_fil_rev_8_21_14_0_10_36_11]|nr:MAG: hypothetical protein COV17_01745 [Candidatus Woesearchaeota archaeon CG10_big_fil_rev_8_21_14_0_10_36_11]